MHRTLRTEKCQKACLFCIPLSASPVYEWMVSKHKNCFQNLWMKAWISLLLCQTNSLVPNWWKANHCVDHQLLQSHNNWGVDWCTANWAWVTEHEIDVCFHYTGKIGPWDRIFGWRWLIERCFLYLIVISISLSRDVKKSWR